MFAMWVVKFFIKFESRPHSVLELFPAPGCARHNPGVLFPGRRVLSPGVQPGTLTPPFLGSFCGWPRWPLPTHLSLCYRIPWFWVWLTSREFHGLVRSKFKFEQMIYSRKRTVNVPIRANYLKHVMYFTERFGQIIFYTDQDTFISRIGQIFENSKHVPIEMFCTHAVCTNSLCCAPLLPFITHIVCLPGAKF